MLTLPALRVEDNTGTIVTPASTIFMFTVFLSYSHDSPEHKTKVFNLVGRMRSSGLDVIFDQDMIPLGGPAEGWPKWSAAQVTNADRVLIVCTQDYRERYENTAAPGIGLGCVCEGGIINQLLYNSGGVNVKFRPVIFAAEDQDHVPLELQRYHRYNLFNSGDYDQMLTWLRGGNALAPAVQVASVAWPAPSSQYDWSLADRTDVFESFEKIITGKDARRVLLISGSTNKGKTALNSELLAYCRYLGITSALIDFKGCPTLDEVFESIRLDLGPAILQQSYHASGPGRFLNLIADFQQLTTPLVLVFDTYEQSSADAQKWLESQLLLRFDKAPSIIAVIGGQKVPDRAKYAWRTFSQLLELQPISEPSYWVEYLQRRWQYHTQLETIEAFTTATNGDPGKLSALFETLVTRSRQKAGASQ